MPSFDLTADACSVLNLVNSGHAQRALSGLPSVVRLTPGVVKESCVKTNSGAATKCLIEANLLEEEPELVTYQELEDLIIRESLGAGECETILSCSKTGRTMCCDDKKARKLAIDILGQNRLIGSLSLLRRRVIDGVLSADEAFESYMQMVARGGFLPVVGRDFFLANGEK